MTASIRETDDLLRGLALEPAAERTWEGPGLVMPHARWVFGGIVAAQALVAAATTARDKVPRSVRVRFLRQPNPTDRSATASKRSPIRTRSPTAGSRRPQGTTSLPRSPSSSTPPTRPTSVTNTSHRTSPSPTRVGSSRCGLRVDRPQRAGRPRERGCLTGPAPLDAGPRHTTRRPDRQRGDAHDGERLVPGRIGLAARRGSLDRGCRHRDVVRPRFHRLVPPPGRHRRLAPARRRHTVRGQRPLAQSRQLVSPRRPARRLGRPRRRDATPPPA